MLLLIEKVLMNSRILNDMMDLQKIAFTNCYDNAFDSILKSGKETNKSCSKNSMI